MFAPRTSAPVPGTAVLPPPSDIADGLVPAALFVGLPGDPRCAARAVGVQPAAFMPMPDGALQADFTFPSRAAWRLWPQEGRAVWIGSGPASAEPPVPGDWERPSVHVRALLHALAIDGTWPQEGRVLSPSGWSCVLRASRLARALDERMLGFGGIFGDNDGRAVRAIVFHDARVWADDGACAEQLLATAWEAASERRAVP